MRALKAFVFTVLFLLLAFLFIGLLIYLGKVAGSALLFIFFGIVIFGAVFYGIYEMLGK